MDGQKAARKRPGSGQGAVKRAANFHKELQKSELVPRSSASGKNGAVLGPDLGPFWVPVRGPTSIRRNIKRGSVLGPFLDRSRVGVRAVLGSVLGTQIEQKPFRRGSRGGLHFGTRCERFF